VVGASLHIISVCRQISRDVLDHSTVVRADDFLCDENKSTRTCVLTHGTCRPTAAAVSNIHLVAADWQVAAMTSLSRLCPDWEAAVFRRHRWRSSTSQRRCVCRRPTTACCRCTTTRTCPSTTTSSARVAPSAKHRRRVTTIIRRVTLTSQKTARLHPSLMLPDLTRHYTTDSLIVAAHSNGQAIIFCSCGYFLLSFLLFLFSLPILSGRKLDVYHTSTHDVALVQI